MMNSHVNKPTAEDMADKELSQSIQYSDGDVWTTKGTFLLTCCFPCVTDLIPTKGICDG